MTNGSGSGASLGTWTSSAEGPTGWQTMYRTAPSCGWQEASVSPCVHRAAPGPPMVLNPESYNPNLERSPPWHVGTSAESTLGAPASSLHLLINSTLATPEVQGPCLAWPENKCSAFFPGATLRPRPSGQGAWRGTLVELFRAKMLTQEEGLGTLQGGVEWAGPRRAVGDSLGIP